MQLDTPTSEARQTWSYESEDCLHVYYLGESHPLDNGNMLIVWSTSGRIDQVTAAGQSVWRIEADLGAGFGFVDHVASLY